MNDLDDKTEPTEPTKLSMAEIAREEYVRTRTPGMYHLKLEEIKRKAVRQVNRTEPFLFHFTDDLEAAGDTLPVYDRLIEMYLERDILPEEINEDIDYALSQIAEVAIGEGMPSEVDRFLDFHEDYYDTVSRIVYKDNPRYKFLMAVMGVVDGLFEWKPVHSIAAYKWLINRVDIYKKYEPTYFEDCPDDIYEYLISLKLNGDSDESEGGDPRDPTPRPIKPIEWKGQRNVLVDVFVQLKQTYNSHNEPLIKTSYRDLAVFLKNNFSCFADTEVSTIESTFDKVSKGTRPHAKKRIDIQGIKKDMTEN